MIIAHDDSTQATTDPWTSIRNLRVLCIGNGGIVFRRGQVWSHQSVGNFLAEMGGLVGEICFCAWSDPNDDPLAQTALQEIPGARVLGLPPIRGSILTKLTHGLSSLGTLRREVSHADFVYLYWPGRLSSIAARLCRALGKPYAIYFRGEQIATDSTFATAFRHARFALATGDSLRIAANVHCQDVEDVTPMTSVRTEHVRTPQRPRESGLWQLLYVGRLEERKGVWDLLEAASYLEEWAMPFMLTLVGHGLDESELLRTCSPSLARRVRVVGAVADFEDLIPFYYAADVFVFPSHDEGFPRVLYEAMACGVPIVTTFVGSIPGVMQDRKNCLRIQPRHPKDLAYTIRHLVTSPELQTQIAWASHQCITELMKTWTRSHPIQIAEKLRTLGIGR